jgi:hypothetical protein
MTVQIQKPIRSNRPIPDHIPARTSGSAFLNVLPTLTSTLGSSPCN